MDFNICPVCNEGHLVDQVEQDEVVYRDQKGSIPAYFLVCELCGSETTTARQIRDNKRAYIAFQKQVDNLLSGDEVGQILQKLNLTQSEAAKIFGGGAVAFSKYRKDDVKQSDAMDRLLRVSSEVPAAFHWLKSFAGIRASNLHVQLAGISWLTSPQAGFRADDEAGYEGADTHRHREIVKVSSANSAEFGDQFASEVG